MVTATKKKRAPRKASETGEIHIDSMDQDIVRFLSDFVEAPADPLLEEIDEVVRDLSAVRYAGTTATMVTREGTGKTATLRLGEDIVFDPKLPNSVPMGSGSQLSKLAMEDRLWATGPNDTLVSLGSVNLIRAMEVANKLWLQSPLMRRIVTTYTFLTIGEGVKVTWHGGDKRASGKKLQRQWERRAEEVGFDAKVEHLVSMAYLHGESFAVFTGKRQSERDLAYLEPDRVPAVLASGGFDDAVMGYQVDQGPGRDKKTVPAESVVHLRTSRLGNIPRGIPITLPVMRHIREFDNFIDNRMMINKIRARYPATVEVNGAQGAVTSEKARIRSQGLPKAGTILVLPNGYRINFPQGNIGASDVADDVKVLAQSIAAGVNLPVFVVLNTGDGTYSGSIVVESPMIRMFKHQQALLRPQIARMVSGIMGKPVSSFSVKMPPVIQRGASELAAAIGVLLDRGVVSKRTANEWLGLHWDGEDGEAARIANESEELGMFGQIPGMGLPMATNAKKVDGGPGEPPQGTSQGAAASSAARKDRAVT